MNVERQLIGWSQRRIVFHNKFGQFKDVVEDFIMLLNNPEKYCKNCIL